MPAMLLAWCFGVSGFLSGLASMAYLRSGRVPDVATAARNAAGSFDWSDRIALYNAAGLEAMQRAYRVMMPISIAQLLLGGLLVIASGMAMSGRRDARGLAVQALLANAALTFVVYALTRGVRGAAIDAFVRASDALSPAMQASLPTREALWWGSRIVTAGHIGLLALGVYALTRPRTRAYFAAVARVVGSSGDS